jgi:hypothetical protein
MTHRIYGIPFADVYELYIKKLERKDRTQAELDEIIEWLTGYDQVQLKKHLDAKTTFPEFYDAAKINDKAREITGVICGVRVQEIEDPLMRKLRYLDKLVDELYKGWPMAKVKRSLS